MKRLLSTSGLLMVILITNAQTYNQYQYDKNGIPVKTGYVTVTPAQPQFAPYVPPYDPKLYAETQQAYREVILRKQAQYNEQVQNQIMAQYNARWEAFNTLCVNLGERLKKVKVNNPQLADKCLTTLQDYSKEMQLVNPDFSNTDTYNFWWNKFHRIYDTLFTWE